MASSGRAQRASSPTGAVRAPNLSRYYSTELPAITPGDFEFRIDLLRGGRPGEQITRYVESFEWTDDTDTMSGALQIRRPDPEDRLSLPVGEGHRIRCKVRWGGAWYTLWVMRVGEIDEPDTPSGAVTVPLNDDMVLVNRGKRRYLYRRSKRRKSGWFGHDALADAAREDGIQLGAIAKCTTRMPKIDVEGSFLDLAKKIYAREQEKTGISYVLRMRDGKFEAVPYKRNRVIFVITRNARSIKPKRTREVETPLTSITGTARLKKGGRKIRFELNDRAAIRRFGYLHEKKDYGRVESIGELRTKVKRELAKNLRVTTTVTTQTQGLPFLRRGDGARVVSPENGLTGKASYFYAESVRHQVQAGAYTTDASFVQDDPFLEAERERAKEQRAKKRAAREKRRG